MNVLIAFEKLYESTYFILSFGMAYSLQLHLFAWLLQAAADRKNNDQSHVVVMNDEFSHLLTNDFLRLIYFYVLEWLVQRMGASFLTHEHFRTMKIDIFQAMLMAKAKSLYEEQFFKNEII